MRFDLQALAKSKLTRKRVIECRPIVPRVGVEKDYQRILNRLISQAAEFVRSDILPIANAERMLLTRDDVGSRLFERFRGFRSLIERLEDVAAEMVQRIFEAESVKHEERFRDAVRSAIGIDIAAVLASDNLADLLSLRVQENVRLITSLGDEIRTRVERAVYDNLRTGETAKTLAKRLNEEFGITRRRAKLIARDQTAKLTSDLTQARQQQAGIVKYRWSTSGDERVRPTHRANDDKIFRWDEPPATTGHPGHDINCRCVAIAVIEIE